MKKSLCLILSAITIFLFTSCHFGNNAKRISPEETEKHYYKYVEAVENCIEENDIKAKDIATHFDNGHGYIMMLLDKRSTRLHINIDNNRYNPLGKDYESGFETYKIYVERRFADADDRLIESSSVLKIISTVLTEATGENVTEEEIKEYFEQCKEDIELSDYDPEKLSVNLANVDGMYKNEHFGYSLMFYPKYLRDAYSEQLQFGGADDSFTYFSKQREDG